MEVDIIVVALKIIIVICFRCCLSVVLYLDKGDYHENSHYMFCPNK